MGRRATVLMLVGCGSLPPEADPASGLEPVCATAAAPRQVRLLNPREYAATVRDLLQLVGEGACTDDWDCDLDIASCVDSQCAVDACDVVTFQLRWDAAGQVVLAGSLNDWGGTAAEGGWPLERVPGSDVWYLKRSLPPGEHAYKFVVDGQTWVSDPTNPWTTDDGFGGVNSVAAIRCDSSELTADPSSPSAGLPAASRPEGWAFDNHVASGVVSSGHLDAYMGAARELASASASRLAAAAGCGVGDRPCAERFVESFGRRAFRRPLTPSERARYTTFVEDDFEEGVGLVVEAMLLSPGFLYRSEAGELVDGVAVLDGYERASALSYFLWGTMPDDALLDAAETGELDTPEGLRSHAERMLQDPQARSTAADFATQWLGVERVLTADKRTDLFPDWTVSARTSAVRETRAFYTHTVFDSGESFDALLTSPVHFVDPHLASLYGVTAPGSELAPMALEGRPGVLGQVAVLSATAHSDQTSPVRRGLFVRERLLCQEFGAPPPEAGGVPDVDAGASTRERFEQHMDAPVCNTCHRYIDPVGFGFEDFDPVGAIRELDGGRPIDSSGFLEDVARDGGPTETFHSLDELASLLVASDAPARCFVRELNRFATGFEEAEDDCAVQALAERFEASGRNVRQLMVDIVTAPTFTTRRETP